MTIVTADRTRPARAPAFDRSPSRLPSSPGTDASLDATSGVEVDLGIFGLAELLRLLGWSRAHGDLEVVSADTRGTVRLLGSGSASAACRSLRGMDAVLSLLEQENGTLHYRRDVAGPASAETFSVEEALLQSSWLDDELRRRHGTAPRPEDVLEPAAGAVSPEDDRERQLPLRGVFEALRQVGPIPLAALEALELCAPRRLRLSVAQLLESGHVVRVSTTRS